jgi:sucrose phosphorylase
MHTGNCRNLSVWAENLENPSDTCTYFNFLDSHDGVGLLGARGYLSEVEIEAMVEKTKEHGGLVSYRTSREGEDSPYELNITWFDALNNPKAAEPADMQVDRFIASRAIGFVITGVPAIYIQSLTGSQLVESVDPSELDEPRSINRRAPCPEKAVELLSDRSSIPYKILNRFRDLGKIRNSNAAFHPNGPQRIFHTNEGVFTVLRISPDGSRRILALTNVTAEKQEVRLAQGELGIRAEGWKDLLSSDTVPVENGAVLFKLAPYRVMWLEPY